MCQRCGQPAQPPYRKYCSDACRDTYQRAQIKLGKLPRGVARKTFRIYDYRQEGQVGE